MFKKIAVYLKPFLNFKFLVSFGIAWIITNGWAYILLVIATVLKINALIIICSSYIAFLFMPFTVEKIVTIPLAIFIHTRLFKNDTKTRKQLDEMYSQAKKDFNKIKLKFKKMKIYKITNLKFVELSDPCVIILSAKTKEQAQEVINSIYKLNNIKIEEIGSAKNKTSSIICVKYQ